MKNSPLVLKIKLAIGYLILIVFFGLIVYVARKEKNSFDEIKRDEAILQERREAISHSFLRLLSLVSLGETLSVWDENDLSEYQTMHELVLKSLVELKQYVSDSMHINRIGVLYSYLADKEQIIHNMVHTLRSVEENNHILEERVSSISKSTQQKTETLPQTPVPKRKTGLFSFFKKKEKQSVYAKMMEQRNSKNEKSFSLNPAYTVHPNFISRQKENRQLLLVYADSLRNCNQYINDKIHELIQDFEDNTMAMQKHKMRDLSEKREKVFRIILIVALSAFVLVILFFIIIHYSINKYFKYQCQLEESDRKNKELLLSRRNMMLSISHDIRAPLSNIHGYAELINKEKDKVLKDKYLSHILNTSKYIISLANNLLDYYRLEAGKEQIRTEIFCPATLFTSIVEGFFPQAELKSLSITTQLEGLNTLVSGDCSHLQRIVDNLLSNAIKFTSTGNIHIGAFYDNGLLRFFVRDTGIGISQEKQQFIFEEFEKYDNDRPGFGLGLTIVAGLTCLLGGTLKMESQVGHGSTFEVCLPMEEADNNQSISNLLPQAEELSGVHVLLIDDDSLQLDMTKKIFEHNRIYCDVCLTTKELIIFLRKNEYDIILVDIQMPGTDGYGVLKLLKNSNIEQIRTIPILAVTACVGQDDTKFKEAGFSGCLHKPFSSEELLETISSHVRRRTCLKRELDFTMLLSGENDKKGILVWFIHDMEKCLLQLQKALIEKDYKVLGALIHKNTPVWENIHIDVSIGKLRHLSNMDTADWDESLHPLIDDIIVAVEHAVLFAGKLLKEDI